VYQGCALAPIDSVGFALLPEEARVELARFEVPLPHVPLPQVSLPPAPLRLVPRREEPPSARRVIGRSTAEGRTILEAH